MRNRCGITRRRRATTTFAFSTHGGYMVVGDPWLHRPMPEFEPGSVRISFTPRLPAGGRCERRTGSRRLGCTRRPGVTPSRSLGRRASIALPSVNVLGRRATVDGGWPCMTSRGSPRASQSAGSSPLPRGSRTCCVLCCAGLPLTRGRELSGERPRTPI